MEEICSDIVGSSAGEMFYKCMAETAGYTHWSGPFFTALMLGLLCAILIGAIVSN